MLAQSLAPASEGQSDCLDQHVSSSSAHVRISRLAKGHVYPMTQWDDGKCALRLDSLMTREALNYRHIVVFSPANEEQRALLSFDRELIEFT